MQVHVLPWPHRPFTRLSADSDALENQAGANVPRTLKLLTVPACQEYLLWIGGPDDRAELPLAHGEQAPAAGGGESAQFLAQTHAPAIRVGHRCARFMAHIGFFEQLNQLCRVEEERLLRVFRKSALADHLLQAPIVTELEPELLRVDHSARASLGDAVALIHIGDRKA